MDLPEPVVVVNVEDRADVWLGRPFVEALPGGRIVVTVDQLGPGVRDLPGRKGKHPHFKNWLQGKVLTYNDEGKTWTLRHTYPFSNARIIRDGNILYLLGDAGSLQIAKSSDGGTTWSEPEDLTARESGGDAYVMAPTNILLFNGQIHVAAMRITDLSCKGSLFSTYSLVVLRARAGANLVNAKSWAFSEPTAAFRDLVSQGSLDHFGIPFYNVPYPDRGQAVAHGRWANRIGWHDPHLVRIADPQHAWFDAAGHSVHVLACADVHRSNVAVLMKVVEDETGRLSMKPERALSGTGFTFLPVPGGNMKFHVAYDDASKLYWLAANDVRDSMTRVDKLPATRQGLPCEEDRALQLAFSRNLVDWSFAGTVARAGADGEFIRDSALAIHGNDLYVVGLLGRAAPGTSHNADRVMFFRVAAFRALAG